MPVLYSSPPPHKFNYEINNSLIAQIQAGVNSLLVMEVHFDIPSPTQPKWVSDPLKAASLVGIALLPPHTAASNHSLLSQSIHRSPSMGWTMPANLTTSARISGSKHDHDCMNIWTTPSILNLRRRGAARINYWLPFRIPEISTPTTPIKPTTIKPTANARVLFISGISSLGFCVIVGLGEGLALTLGASVGGGGGLVGLADGVSGGISLSCASGVIEPAWRITSF
jgi:hypothetical protein